MNQESGGAFISLYKHFVPFYKIQEKFLNFMQLVKIALARATTAPGESLDCPDVHHATGPKYASTPE